jgi:hypothetical protein
MTLSDCRFYCCGNELNFSMFSNVVCRARYLESIQMTLVGEGRVDVYAIEPAPASRWIVVRHTEGDGMVCRWFVREGEMFLERNQADLPQQIRAEVFHLFPHLAQPTTLAA